RCTEESPFAPSNNIYCETKIGAEEAVRDLGRKGLPYVIIRPANVYGPGPSVWTVRPAKLARSGRLFPVAGGTGICNPVYVDNLVDALLAAATKDGINGQVYT